MEEGWDQPLGLKAEILPLTRPYGLWAGNTFCGKALFNGNVTFTLQNLIYYRLKDFLPLYP